MTPSTPESTTSDSWHQVLPDAVETDSPSDVSVAVHVPHGTNVRVTLEDATGETVFLEQVEDNTPPRDVAGVLTGQASFALGDLNPGEYTLRAYLQTGVMEQTAVRVLDPPAATCAPEAARVGRAEYNGRVWGVSVSPYALRSHQSWGIGDLADVADLAVTVAQAGGDYLLVTPIVRTIGEAVAELGLDTDAEGAVVVDPIYIRPEDIREAAYLPSAQRTMLDWSSEGVRESNAEPEAINFADVWENKRAALEVIYSGARSAARDGAFKSFLARNGAALAPYARAAVAAEGGIGADLFAELQAETTSGALTRREHAERLDFHLWLQWIAREQLARAQRLAQNAGMSIGLVHSVSQDAGAQAVSDLGAFGGGIFLTQVQDPSAARLTVAAGHANGLLVFGEASGRDCAAALSDQGITPQLTLRTEFSAAEPGDLGSLPTEVMLAVATTDDPPTAGALAEEHLELMARLGLGHEDHEERRKAERILTDRLLEALRAADVLPLGATERQKVEGLHELLTRSPAQYLTLTLSDAVGNRRPFVLGGGYPDWAYPYTDGAGASVLVDRLADNPRFGSLLERIDEALRRE